MNTRLLFTAGAIAILVVGCGYSTETDEPEPSNTPLPTSTPLPTATPIPTSTPVPPTPVPSDTPTPEPPVILTEDGFRIVYIGSLEAQAAATLEVTFQVFGPDDQPAQGTFFVTLGDPPSDSRASHANGQLDPEGKIALTLGVNWPAGITKLYCGFQDQVYEVAEVVIDP